MLAKWTTGHDRDAAIELFKARRKSRLGLVVSSVALVSLFLIMLRLFQSSRGKVLAPTSKNLKEFGLSDICSHFLSPTEDQANFKSLTKSLRKLVGKRGSTRLAHLRRKIGCALLKEKTVPHSYKREQLGRVSLMFINKYIKTARRKQGVYFHGIAQAGGIDMCSTAWANGCRAPENARNPSKAQPGRPGDTTSAGQCYSNEFEDQISWWPRRGRQVAKHSCGSRKNFMTELGLNFMANLGYLPEELKERPCSDSGLLTAITIREPGLRTISHLVDLIRGDWHLNRIGQCLPANVSREHYRTVRWEQVNVTCLSELQYIASDNHQVRMMSGREGYERPRGEVTNEDFESAVRTLLRFDVLDVIDARKPWPLDFHPEGVLQVGLGFLSGENPSRDYLTSAQLRVEPVDEEVSQQDVFEVRKMNRYDSKLFKVAEDVFALDLAVYNRTHRYCSDHYKKLGKRLMVGCEALLSRPLSIPTHPIRILENEKDQKVPHGCGCGFAGSLERRKTFGPRMGLITGRHFAQECPRRELFDKAAYIVRAASQRAVEASKTSR